MNCYDYIIVGAGSAGCVLARRLSEDRSTRVLLVEAGPPADDFWIRAPAGMGKLFRSEHYNWCFETEPVPTLRNRRIYWPRGKTLGGSSAINGMVYVRGHRRDFDHWRDLGNPGWGWDDVLPYFRRSVCRPGDTEKGSESHGLLTVSDPSVLHPAALAFVEAAQRTGLTRLDDFNEGEQEGVGLLRATIRNGVRQSTYDAFVAPIVARRPNLDIRTGAHVHRLLFAGVAATGIEAEIDGQIQRFHAAREVVLCAGALSSPHLLMLSGIGDAEQLRRHGIATVAHLPGVGKNLQDHFAVRVQARTTREGSYNQYLAGWRKYAAGARYLLTKGGYLALGSSIAAAFFRSGPQVAYADMEVSFRPMTVSYAGTSEAVVDDFPAISASVYRVRPDSRGEVILRSADPMQSPAFVPNYLHAPEDIGAMLAGLRRLRQILAMEPLASFVLEELVPGKEVRTDAQWIDYMEREGQCAFHPAGTCKMGNDRMAVVDARLRVQGVERLRVVDASIMPVVTSGNTNAPTIMIGEKGADMILADQRAASRAA
ncbi:Alcohol dehydrogenase [acceptor] [Cupriavidus yeoncheonensis]|uniref:Alcohol dehydrogenase [acceptor] n=1 Tax=Cupriavidus yeoncheonensis TaxID=1462994 RepID=A0A916IZI4_9BURK|nr:GMC family oxidoreductase N-terminal domain-containing protein [Cupriavidus yeoncheonensis]CAG2153756.1 Alcohol dehydrogenase [acceptor] [Cupriavidus yeoncheonensis]